MQRCETVFGCAKSHLEMCADAARYRSLIMEDGLVSDGVGMVDKTLRELTLGFVEEASAADVRFVDERDD